MFSTALLASAAILSIASAQALSVADVNANAKIEIKTTSRATSSVAKTEDNDNATNSEKRNTEATSSEENEYGQLNAEAHRSTVASFVQSLLNVANREGGIGAQVREIAKSQNDSASTTVSAMANVDERGSLRTFFFGSDYKNLGVIRSEMATTSNNIAKLESLLSRTTNTADRVELSAQIQALKTEQAKLDTYVTTHENVFSLFGWFNKLFVK